jgi:peptidoglycan/LPS O-acetylase OafA/YrhL
MLWRLLSTPVAGLVGSASYAIYILHVPVLWWFKRSRVYAELPPFEAGMVFLVGVLAFSIIVSKYLEGPANAFVRGKLLSILLRRTRKAAATQTPTQTTGRVDYKTRPAVS